jgi:hypothetical protein
LELNRDKLRWVVGLFTRYCQPKGQLFKLGLTDRQRSDFVILLALCKKNDLLKLNRDQLRWVVGLFAGHCHLKGHLFKLGLTDNPTCERCLEEDESATHILCDYEAIAYLRFRHLGQFFMEPSDYYDAVVNRVLHFIRSVGLIKG